MNEQKTKITPAVRTATAGANGNIGYKVWISGLHVPAETGAEPVQKESFTNFLLEKAMTAMNEKLNNMPILRITVSRIEAVAKELNPVLQGWINYYGKFYKTKLKDFMRGINAKLANWAIRKYKKIRVSLTSAMKW